MIIAQVVTIKGHSKAVFITPHNATDVASFEGNVQLACWLQECPPELLPVNWMLISLPCWEGLDLTAVCRRNRLEWANTHIRWRLALWRGALFTDESRFSLYRADGSQHVWRRVGEQFADVNIVDRVAHGGGGVMVWAGICWGQWTQMHFIDCILNAQKYHDEILRPTVVSFIHDHHLMLQHDNARPHVARICTQFLEAETIQFLHGQHTHRTCHLLSMFGMLWIGVYDSVFQFLPISSNFSQPLKRSGPTFHRPQSTTWATLCEGDVFDCVRQMVVTPDTDWFSDPPPPYSTNTHFRVAFYCGQLKAHPCNNHAV